MRAVAELDERLQLGSHKDRNGHDDRQENQEDRTKSGHSGGQLLPVRLKRDGKIKTYSIDLDRSSVGQTTLLTSPKLIIKIKISSSHQCDVIVVRRGCNHPTFTFRVFGEIISWNS